MDLIDREAVLARMDGDEDLLREIVGMFLEYAPQRREAIRTAFENGDLTAIRRTAHSLKGSVGYLEAVSVVEAIRQLDQLAVSADTERLPEALAELERLLEELTIEAAALVQTAEF